MLHFVAQSEARARLWSTWAEGLALFSRVLAACPGAVALVVMPDHLHLLHDQDVRLPLARALSGDTRARRSRDGGAAGIVSSSAPEEVLGPEKIRRSVRYVHLNPCRAGLCADPLAWPLSTHRDAVGLALPALVRQSRAPERFHAYVSADPTVAVGGTPLPVHAGGPVSAGDVLVAVSALTRTPIAVLRRRGPARTLYLAAAAELADDTAAEIAGRVAASPQRVRASTATAEAIDVVRRVLRDPRFPAMPDGPARFGRR